MSEFKFIPKKVEEILIENRESDSETLGSNAQVLMEIAYQLKRIVDSLEKD